MLRTIFLLFCALIGAAHGQSPFEDPAFAPVRPQIAFLLGTADRFGRFGSGGFQNPEQAALFERKSRELAEALGFVRREDGSIVPDTEWRKKVTGLLQPVAMPTFQSEDWSKVRDGALPLGWDVKSRWAYLLGTYCSSGRDRHIGYFDTRRAFFVAALLQSFQGESSLEVSTLFGYIPGGSRIIMPKDDPVCDKLIMEASALLSAPKEPNKASEPTTTSVTSPAAQEPRQP
jgi:hypothetical protein